MDPKTLQYKEKSDKAPPYNMGYIGSAMPPPESVAGNYAGPDGKKIKVAPLTDEDRLTLVRWIDLDCPVDLDCDLAKTGGTRLRLDAGRDPSDAGLALAAARRQ